MTFVCTTSPLHCPKTHLREIVLPQSFSWDHPVVTGDNFYDTVTNDRLYKDTPSTPTWQTTVSVPTWDTPRPSVPLYLDWEGPGYPFYRDERGPGRLVCPVMADLPMSLGTSYPWIPVYVDVLWVRSGGPQGRLSSRKRRMRDLSRGTGTFTGTSNIQKNVYARVSRYHSHPVRRNWGK